MLGRTVVECTRDRLAARISRNVATVACAASAAGTVLLDPFAGSGNTLVWLARRLKPRVAVGFEFDEAVAAASQRNLAFLGLPVEVRPVPYARGIPSVRVDEADLIVVFIAPPWGDALSDDGELDLRRTTPPVAEVVARVAATFDERRLLVAVQLYERVEPGSLADAIDRCDWSSRETYAIDPPGRNHGLLLGTLGWSP